MKTYVIWYRETDTYKAFLEANNYAEAERKLRAVMRGDLDITEVTNNSASGKDYELEVDLSTLEEVK